VPGHEQNFRAAAKLLAEHGHRPLVPHDVPACRDENCEGTYRETPGGWEYDHDWKCYLRYDLRELLTCDGVALLDGWRASTGAQLERNVAQEAGIDVRELEEWL